MPLVHVKEDETFENALRRFKRKCEKSGILSELKKRQHYEKPSTKRKRKAIAARKKVLRKLAEEVADHVGEIGLRRFALLDRGERMASQHGFLAGRALGLHRDQGQNAIELEGS